MRRKDIPPGVLWRHLNSTTLFVSLSMDDARRLGWSRSPTSSVLPCVDIGDCKRVRHTENDSPDCVLVDPGTIDLLARQTVFKLLEGLALSGIGVRPLCPANFQRATEKQHECESRTNDSLGEP